MAGAAVLAGCQASAADRARTESGTDALAGCLTDPRDPGRIRHDLRTMLAQRIYGLALGYEDLNDHTTLRQDPLFAVLADRRPRPPYHLKMRRCSAEPRVGRC